MKDQAHRDEKTLTITRWMLVLFVVAVVLMAGGGLAAELSAWLGD